MNTINKVGLALVAVIVIAGGAYVMLSGSPVGESMVADLKDLQNSMIADETSDVGASVPIPPATDSIDDFAAAMQADLAATVSAIDAFDADVQASVESVNSVSNTNTLYDPNNL